MDIRVCVPWSWPRNSHTLWIHPGSWVRIKRVHWWDWQCQSLDVTSLSLPLPSSLISQDLCFFCHLRQSDCTAVRIYTCHSFSFARAWSFYVCFSLLSPYDSIIRLSAMLTCTCLLWCDHQPTYTIGLGRHHWAISKNTGTWWIRSSSVGGFSENRRQTTNVAGWSVLPNDATRQCSWCQ